MFWLSDGVQLAVAPQIDREIEAPPAGRAHRALNAAARRLVTFTAVAVVSFGAAVFAFAFRESLLAVARSLAGGNEGPIAAARALGPLPVVALVTFGLTVAAWMGRVAQRRHGARLGLRAIAAAARDEQPDPSPAGTAIRTAATWVATASLASLGREAPIMEMGGLLGTTVGKAARRPGHRLAVTGIAAAFAVAYHAPVAAVLYVEDHLGVRHDRRTVAHAVGGAALGFFIAQQLLGGHPIFPAGVAPLSRDALLLALLGLPPAYIASRAFLEMRERLAARAKTARTPWKASLLLAVIAGVAVAFVPLTAGNGMEALRYGATAATAGLAVALVLGKLVATAASVASSAPGGVVSPSLAVAGGAALATFIVLDAMGVHLVGSRWDGILIAMAIGVAVSVRSPLVAFVMVPEMAGDLRLLPLTALVVSASILLDRAVDRRVRRAGDAVPATLHDQDG